MTSKKTIDIASISARAGLVSGLAVVALFVSSPVAADDVPAGFDLWVTAPGDAEHDFSTSPLPADFFYPGSDPFVSFVALQGTGFGCGGSDTVVERLSDAALPVIPSTDVVPIEIVELQLTSVTPLIVTGTSPEQWAMDVTLPPGPQPPGSMKINHLDARGGTYDSSLPVCPLFTFTRIGPPATLQFDLCLEGFPPLLVQAIKAAWTHDVQLPLQCGPGPNTPRPSSPDFLPLGPHIGPLRPQPLETPTPIAGVPALGGWGIGVLLLLIAAVCVNLMGRRVGARSVS